MTNAEKRHTEAVCGTPGDRDHNSRILVYRNGAVGDTVLTGPAIQALRALRPEVRIALLGHKDRCRLLVRDGLADEALDVEDYPLHCLTSDGPWPNDLTGLFRHVDNVIWYGIDHDKRLTEGLTAYVPHVHVHPPKPADGSAVHIIDHLLAPVRDIGSVPNQPPVQLPVTPEERARARALLAGIPAGTETVFLAPGASSADKRWPIERFRDFAHGLSSTAGGRYAYVILIGPEEVDLGRALHDQLLGLSNLSVSNVKLLEPLPLADVAAVISRGALYVGNDSGTTHLAAALGVPTLSVFLTTDPAVWSPRGLRSAWVHSDRGTDAVIAAARELICPVAVWDADNST